jgi:uncharacterized protein YegP (UPF0339 family)
MVNQIEVEYNKLPDGWQFIINRNGILAHSEGYATKRDAKRAANDILKDLRARNVIHVNKLPVRKP